MDLRASTRVPLPPEAAWDLWVDANRYPQWQGGVLAVRDVSGPVAVAGTTYTLDHGPKMQRHVTVVAAERPARHVVEQTGMGIHDITTVTFEADGGGTLVTYTVFAHLNRIMGLLSRLDRRSRMEGEVQAELDRFAALAGRRPVAARVGARYAVRAAMYRRHVDVLATDGDVVHLRLLPGWGRTDKPHSEPLQQPKPFPSDYRLWPLPPPVRAHPTVVQQGLPFLARDGGFGVRHLALRPGPWADADPEEIGDAEPLPAEPDMGDDVPIVGDRPDLELAPTCTLQLASSAEGDVWAHAKFLRVEILRVHLALGPGRWSTRPEGEPAWGVESGADRAVPRVGHVPVSRTAFDRAKPRFAGIVTMLPDELDGFQLWREAKGGTFETLEPMADPVAWTAPEA